MSENIKIRKRYWTTETFKEEMKERNSNISITGEYINSTTKIHCTCLVDNYEWDARPSDLLQGKGCKNCGYKKRSAKRTHSYDRFVIEFNENNKNAYNIEILGDYVNKKTKIECRCKIDGHIWHPRPSDLLKGSGCPKCYGNVKRLNDEFLYQLKLINENIEVLEEYKNCISEILVRCKIDKYEWHTTPHQLLRGHGCPLCDNKIVQADINSIAAKRPDLIRYFDNTNDAYTSCVNSSKKHNLHCIYCGYKKKMTNCVLSNQGFSCPICSDGISYPNKFSRAFLSQLPIENFIPEYAPKWANGKRYDNYFECQGNKYILEMDGDFHYKDNNLSGLSLNEAKQIDYLKDKLAKEHNISVIRIDSRKSKSEYLKNNILNSKFKYIFDLSKIDWDKCEINATKNIMYDVCVYYKETNESVTNISKHFNISVSTIQIYLNNGTKLGWCEFGGIENLMIMKEPMIAKDKHGNIIAKAKNVYDMIENLKSKYPNIVLKKQCIRNVCRRKHHTHRGLVFEYVS